MDSHRVRVLKIDAIAPTILNIQIEKPEGYTFIPGQATKIKADLPGWKEEGLYFAFASSPKENHLEFFIKTIPNADVSVNSILDLNVGDYVEISAPVGDLVYKDEGTFIAGGVGITPFISIFKHLEAEGKIGNNKLIYANRSEIDIILKEELQNILGDNLVTILEEESDEHHQGFISDEFIKEHQLSSDGYFYLCGPSPMLEAIQGYLTKQNVKKEQIIK